ncbi:MAG TPA: hypothetical protein VMU94_27355 [Streptosporangiaceae bacterium]|nr:hypothetical protein [Streptosporangiaceae bacterium]
MLTDRDIAGRLTERADGLVADYLAAGIDPATATIFAHSAVPALNQLMLPFLSLVSVTELRRNPTVKEEIALSRQQAVSGLRFTYPVHQAADILFCKSNLVPVGKDQLPHLQIARTIARRFNERYAGALRSSRCQIRVGQRVPAPDQAAPGGARGRQRLPAQRAAGGKCQDGRDRVGHPDRGARPDGYRARIGVKDVRSD